MRELTELLHSKGLTVNCFDFLPPWPAVRRKPANPPGTDASLLVAIESHGDINVVRPLTSDATAWLLLNTDGQWFAGTLIVESRHLDELLSGLINDVAIDGKAGA